MQISDVTFRRIEGTSSGPLAVRLLCSEERPCTGVRLDGINLTCGDVPCRSEFSNVPVVAPAPAPGSSPTAAAGGEEEEADVASKVSQFSTARQVDLVVTVDCQRMSSGGDNKN